MGQKRVQREAEDRFDMFEMAVSYGVANATIPGYAAQRARDRGRPAAPATQSDGSWARQMAADFPGMVARSSSDGPLAIGAAP